MKILVTGGSGFIGTHLVERLTRAGHSVLNLDIAAPHLIEHESYWRQVDILDEGALRNAFSGFLPEIVIHLAARTDTDSDLLSEYRVNTAGTSHVISAVRQTPTIRRFIHTSTQFVNQYNGIPKCDTDFAPHTVYGESKVISEQLMRAGELECTWLIVRPTNVWGAWHKRYPFEFWSVLARGLYIHPGYSEVTRAYGYVGNVVQQMEALTTANAAAVQARVFYVGDEPIELLEWVNGFSVAQTGSPVRRVPRLAVRLLAILGDGLNAIGARFPITSSRYRSMTQSNYIPMTDTFAVCGNPPYTLQEGIADTVAWMRVRHPSLIRTPSQK